MVESVRAHWPAEKPLFVRLSVEDDSGWGPDQSVALARILKPKGVDVIDCSSGGMRGSPVVSAGPVTYGYQVPYAERLRKDADIMSMAVGLIVHADQAEQILQEGRADLIALARELLYNPELADGRRAETGRRPAVRLGAAGAGLLARQARTIGEERGAVDFHEGHEGRLIAGGVFDG